MILGMPAARSYLAVFLEGIFVFGTFPYLAPVLQARGLGSGGGASLEAGLAVAAFGAGGFVYAAMARPLLGRIGQSRMVRLGGGLAAAALLGFAFAPLATVFIAAGLVLGTGFYMIHNSIQTRVTEVAPEGHAVRRWRCTPSTSSAGSPSGRCWWAWRSAASARRRPSCWRRRGSWR